MNKDYTGHSIKAISTEQASGERSIVRYMYIAFIGGMVIGSLITLCIQELLK